MRVIPLSNGQKTAALAIIRSLETAKAEVQAQEEALTALAVGFSSVLRPSISIDGCRYAFQTVNGQFSLVIQDPVQPAPAQTDQPAEATEAPIEVPSA